MTEFGQLQTAARLDELHRRRAAAPVRARARGGGDRRWRRRLRAGRRFQLQHGKTALSSEDPMTSTGFVTASRPSADRCASAAAASSSRSRAHAELTRVEILSRVDVLNGKAFGDVGPYEKIWGRAHFAIDPANPRNQMIADIDFAPRDAPARWCSPPISSSSSPRIPARGNGVVFFDVVNRGRFRLLSTFSDATGADDPTTEAHFGDASLLRSGLHAGRGGLAVRRPGRADRRPGADRDQRRPADQGLGARVVHLGQAGRVLQLDRRQRHQGLPPGGRQRRRLPADRPRGHVRRAAADPARRLAVRPHRRRHVTSPIRTT